MIPRRHEGSDDPENLLTLCPTCHSKIENVYDDEFYREIGALEPSELENQVVEYKNVKTSEKSIWSFQSEKGWSVRYDDGQKFSFYCPECDSVAETAEVKFDRDREEFLFRIFCRDCRIKGTKKLYTHPEGDDELEHISVLSEAIKPPEKKPKSNLRKTTDIQGWNDLGKKVKELRKQCMDIWSTGSLPKSETERLEAMFRDLDKFRSGLEGRMFEEYPEEGDVNVFY